MDKVQPTPLPWGQVALCFAIMSAEFLTSHSVIPFAPYMVRWFGVTDDERQIGYWVGFITATFSIGQIVSSYWWGRFSDIHGRKKATILGLFFTAVSLLCFGLAGSLWQAAAARFFAGLMNGNISVIKSVIGEITDESNQATAFGIFGLATSVGMVLGPIIGGTLSSPADRFPNTFDFPIFRDYPYFLPTFIVALSVLGCALAAALFMVETHPRFKDTKTLHPDLELDTLLEPSNDNDTKQPDLIPHDAPLPPAAFKAVHCYALLALQYIMLDELFPLWSMQEKVGLGFQVEDVGHAMAVKGLGLLLGPVLFPVLERAFGSRKCLIMASVASIPFFLFPDIALLRAFTPGVVVFAVMALMPVISIVSNIAFSSVMLLVNNSVPSERTGELNGLSQMYAAIARSVGPILCSFLFSFSLEHGLPFPLDIHLSFLVVSICAVLVVFSAKKVAV